MKALNYLFLTIAVVLTGCTKTQVTEQQTSEPENSTEAYSLEPEIDTMNLVIEEKPYIPIVSADPTEDKAAHKSNSYSSSSYESESEGSYWEEKRKTSPNDNYLLGFDEDVDDVHDMEIYMEDY